MSATISELFGSRRQITDPFKPTAEFYYLVQGAADETAAIALAQSTAPSSYNNGYIRQVEITERVMEDTWKITVRYEAPNPEDTIPPTEYNYSTDGGTQHITQALALIGKLPSTAADLNGAIGYDGQNVLGIDVGVSKGSWTEKHYFADGDTEWPTWYNQTNTVNSDTFGGFDPGSLLFNGATGSKRGLSGLWEVSFSFTFSPNQTGIAVPGITGTFDKKGFEYLDIIYGKKVDTTSKVVIQIPKELRVYQVYPTSTFSSLGI